jgi:hypothetical protein
MINVKKLSRKERLKNALAATAGGAATKTSNPKQAKPEGVPFDGDPRKFFTAKANSDGTVDVRPKR